MLYEYLKPFYYLQEATIPGGTSKLYRVYYLLWVVYKNSDNAISAGLATYTGGTEETLEETQQLTWRGLRSELATGKVTLADDYKAGKTTEYIALAPADEVPRVFRHYLKKGWE